MKIDKNRIVKTFTGRKEKRSDCKRIRGQYYFLGNSSIKDSGECYNVEGIIHRFNNGLIEYDHSKNKYVLIHKNNLKYGIVDVIENNPIKGYYSPVLTENVKLLNSKTDSLNDTINCISEDVALKLGYRERYSNGIFYPSKLKDTTNLFFTNISNKLINKNNLPYDSRYVTNIVTNIYNKEYNPTFDNVNLNLLGSFLEENNLTFGLEFETSNGYVAERLCYKYGLLALRDGSIDGLEYVTIPLSGTKGLYALREICKELKLRTVYNLKCALHIHIGGLKREESHLLGCFNLAYLLQSDLFDLQPHYKRGGTGYYNNNKNKDYSKKLSPRLFNTVNKFKTLASKFSAFFNFTSDGRNYEMYDSSLKNVKNHPSDPSGNHKWQISSRYSWINFVPIIFGNKKTIEFRQHSPTFEFEKVINFLIFCTTFIKYVNINHKELSDSKSNLFKEISECDDKFDYIIKKVLPPIKFSNIIHNYNTYNKIRKSIMKKLVKKEDYLGKNEHKYDNEYHILTSNSIWH